MRLFVLQDLLETESDQRREPGGGKGGFVELGEALLVEFHLDVLQAECVLADDNIIDHWRPCASPDWYGGSGRTSYNKSKSQFGSDHDGAYGERRE